MHLKQLHPHLQVVLSIGGPDSSENFPVVANSTLCRDNFARSARGLVEASGLDGIDSEFSTELPGQHNQTTLTACPLYHLSRVAVSHKCPAGL